MAQIIVDRLKKAIDSQEHASLVYQELETMILTKFPFEQLLQKTKRVRKLQRVYFLGGVIDSQTYLPKDYRVLGMSKRAEQELDHFIDTLK